MCAREFMVGNGIDHMYLPPYSPDLNQTENVFGTLKTRFRKKGVVRSRNALERRIRDVIDEMNLDMDIHPLLSEDAQVRLEGPSPSKFQRIFCLICLIVDDKRWFFRSAVAFWLMTLRAASWSQRHSLMGLAGGCVPAHVVETFNSRMVSGS